MSTIILKTVNRPTRVSRLTIRRAVAAVYAGAAATGNTSSPVLNKRKKMAAKESAAA